VTREVFISSMKTCAKRETGYSFYESKLGEINIATILVCSV